MLSFETEEEDEHEGPKGDSGTLKMEIIKYNFVLATSLKPWREIAKNAIGLYVSWIKF